MTEKNKQNDAVVDENNEDFDEEQQIAEQEQQDIAEEDQKTAKLTEEVETLKEKLARALADAENSRRIAKRDIGNAHKFALKPFIESLLPVFDSWEKGMEAAIEHHTVLEGMDLTYKMMLDVLKKYGVEQINPKDKLFNPDEHEAISMQASEDAEANSVLTVVQKGYVLNGRVVRAARVIVAKS